MPAGDVERIDALLIPLLRTLETLGLVSRHFHPPDLADLLAAVKTPDHDLADARALAEPWPEAFAPLGAQLEAASDQALKAFAGLRAAVEQPNAAMGAYRAMRHVSRALEALYPTAGILPPVNRFFLDPARRGDEALQGQLLKPPQPNTGLMCVGGDPDARDSVWIYVPETTTPETPSPLVFALHGGSGNGRGFLWSWLRAARTRGAILVAPSSLGQTWAIQGDDIDTPHLARVVDFVRDNWTVDPGRMLMTGMSDGGTFTWTSGLDGASPFTHLAPVAAAFHPLLAAAADATRLKGLPVHIIHGALDWMFPADMARNAEQYLSARGADVTYRELEDLSHAYSPELSTMILDWLLD